MSKEIERKLAKIPVVRNLVVVLKRIVLPGFVGLSLYDLLEIYTTGIINGAFSTRAGAVAFSFFLALFPSLLFLLNLLPFVPIHNFSEELLLFLQDILPSQTSGLITSIFEDIATNERVGLLSSSFLLSIVFMANGINSAFSGFKFSYHSTINRSFARQYITAVGVSLIVASLLLITVIVTIYFTFIVNQYMNQWIRDTMDWILVGRYMFFIGMLFLIISVLFYYGTSGDSRLSFFSPGALMTIVLTVITTYLFGLYIENFSNYNKLYGSIGVVLILMVYIRINTTLLLLGFELNASINQLKLKN